jgi:hypothetical protein
MRRNIIGLLDKVTVSTLCEQAANRNIRKTADENSDFTI